MTAYNFALIENSPNACAIKFLNAENARQAKFIGRLLKYSVQE